jgi:hypothetical protein
MVWIGLMPYFVKKPCRFATMIGSELADWFIAMRTFTIVLFGVALLRDTLSLADAETGASVSSKSTKLTIHFFRTPMAILLSFVLTNRRVRRSLSLA